MTDSRSTTELGAPPDDASSSASSWLECIVGTEANGSRPHPGQIVDGKYRLGALLGEGGMGWVFEGVHLETEKVVALKYLKPHLQVRSAYQKHLRKEARAAGRLDHPNIVRLYDVGGGAPSAYLVMERLRGETLRTRMTSDRPSIEASLSIVASVLRGVSAAHRSGVVHCDLKPENIMLPTLPDGSSDEPKVLDFGLSRIVRSPDASEGETSSVHHIAGTPGYMPLEQLRGQPPSPRVDVYALGVVLYELLAGKKPFDARTREDLIVQLATRTAPALPESVAGREVSAVVARALEREPAARYATAVDLEQAFREARACRLGSEGLAVSIAPSSRTRLRPARIRTLAAIAVVAAVAFGQLYGASSPTSAFVRRSTTKPPPQLPTTEAPAPVPSPAPSSSLPTKRRPAARVHREPRPPPAPRESQVPPELQLHIEDL